MQLLSSILASALLLNITTMALSFWVRGFALPRTVLVIAIPIQIALLAAHRHFVWQQYWALFGRMRLLIVADDAEECQVLADKFKAHACPWYQTVGCIQSTDQKAIEERLYDVDAVALKATLTSKAEILATCAKTGKEVLVIPDTMDLTLLGATPRQLDDLLILSIHPLGLRPVQLLWKRTIDILGAATGLLLFSPILLVLAVAIPLNSKGRAIFKQERVGKFGRRYQLYKFRTMVDDAERSTGPTLAGYGDPRITTFGRFLRASRLDELPQLVNVLKGDMSLVGPRPERPFFVERFESTIPNYVLRSFVKPGVTGLAQVMGKYTTTAEDKLRFDLMYLHNYSLLLDLKLLFQTVRVVLQPERAKGLDIQAKTVAVPIQIAGPDAVESREESDHSLAA
jgi:exopolysaccharide biosynthesis polyprenyl glycosylphosphotransferase